MKSQFIAALPAAVSILVLISANAAYGEYPQVSQQPELIQANAEPAGGRTIPDLVITPNRYPRKQEQIGSSVSVITEEEIEQSKKLTVAELLRSVPGIHVTQTGGAGGVSSVSIRGAEADHTLILIDGIRVNETTSGQFDFAGLSAENIERIEVLRGPQSVLYGSEAVGGVINIVTKTAKEGKEFALRAEGGSRDTQYYAFSAGIGGENYHSATVISFFDTSGISTAAKSRGNNERDAHDNLSISSRNGLVFAEDAELDLTFRYSTAEVEVDNFDFSVGPIDDPNATFESDQFSASLLLRKPVGDKLQPSILVGISDSESTGRDPDTEFNNFKIDNQIVSVLTQLDFEFVEQAVLTLGHQFERREGENKGNFDESRDLHGFFVQQQLSLYRQVFATAGVRYDDDEDFGEETTFRAALSWLIPSSGSRLHASYGTAFKAPTFNELAFPNFGNPDLEAETSWGYDVGFEQSFADGNYLFDVSFFKSEIDDLITFDTQTFLAANIESASIHGVETILVAEITPGVSGKLSYTYTDSENESTGLILPRRARHQGSLQLLVEPIEALEGSVSIFVVNSRRDSDGAKMDNYERVDCALQYRLTSSIAPFFRIENLFNEDYEEVNGFGSPGFSVYAGIEAKS